MSKLDKIIKKDADWSINKIDFESDKIKDSIKKSHIKQEKALLRKLIDPSVLSLIIK